MAAAVAESAVETTTVLSTAVAETPAAVRGGRAMAS
jgi:hypothetical protein